MAIPNDDLQGLRAELQALTERVSRLEQQSNRKESPATAQPERAQTAMPYIPLRQPAPVIEPIPEPRFAVASGGDDGRDLESKIGKVWFNRIGIIAILIGVSYFIKYAFDSGWVGPSGRVAIGLIAGIAMMLWSERFRKKGFAPFSYSLKAIGIGILYLSLWGAFQIYHLIPATAAFIAMIAVTAATIILAVTENAQILAAFALVGGFSTPILLSTGQNHEVALFSYVAILDLGVLALITFRPWHRLLIGSFIGTVILYIGWSAEYYNLTDRPLTVLFAIIFALIFAVSPLVVPLSKSRWHSGFSATLMLLPLANATALFLALFAMYENEKVTLTWYALALAAAYLALSNQFKRRAGSDAEMVKSVNLLHIAIAIAFITIAIPLKLNQHWITIGWLVESAALLFIGMKARADFVRYFAAITLLLGIVRLLFFDNFHVDTLIFNARFGTYLIAIGILGGIVGWSSRFTTETETPIIQIAGVLLNALALVALTREASDYFSRQLAQWYQLHQPGFYQPLQQIEFSRNFSYSAIWLAYGAGLMVFGFWRKSAFVRWQALALIAFTIGKVFLFDVSALQQGYRILSFVALGVVLMAISYVYHRGWLKLAPESQRAATRTQA